MDNEFKRKLPNEKNKKMNFKAMPTRKKPQKSDEPKNNPPKESFISRFNEKFDNNVKFWSFFITVFALGFGFGMPFGDKEPENETELIEKVNFYKKDNFQLKRDNELLTEKVKSYKAENKEYKEQLSKKNQENSQLSETLSQSEQKIAKYEEEPNKISSKTSSNSKTPEKEISINDTETFLDGSIYVSVTDISVLNTGTIKVGAQGIEPHTEEEVTAGTQFIYKAQNKYQVRINKVDYENQSMEVQVTDLSQ
ncbi:hypothetical protein [Priestia megaterium]|uniref:hypothetical protein n=1 Tax=Priestia megaterium TaxID=1404 RepID=UPI00387307E2|nr:hypothetical protein QY062_24570 [Priestia megaterium]